MKEKEESFVELPIPPKVWAMLIQHSHASTVIWGAAVLDYRLGALLANYMPRLSNTLKIKLFDYPGALSAFSSRIDVAYALGLIKDDMRAALHKARELRNTFAHSPERLSLTDAEPLKLLKQLDPKYRPPA